MASLDKWSPEHFRQMKEIERAVIDVLLPMVQERHPLLGLYALIRCARVLLRKGDRDAQQALLPVIVAYLEGKASAPGEHALLWLPPESRN